MIDGKGLSFASMQHNVWSRACLYVGVIQERTCTSALSLALVAVTVFGIPAAAQTAAGAGQDNQPIASSTTQQTQPSTPDAATQKAPLTQSKEGFWGHLNPFARKKWVRRQVDPITGRVTELDELSSQNTRDIHDVDSRSKAGIQKANDAANAADQHAIDAASRANGANQLATQASSKTDQLHQTVNGLDQYKPVDNTRVKFAPGSRTLTVAAKHELDAVADKLNGQKGYIVEVTGYSPTRGAAGVQASDTIAEAVVRYLVTKHEVPLYRIHKVGMGNATASATQGSPAKVHGSVVDVALLQNSLAVGDTGSAASPGMTPQAGMNGQPSTDGTASKPVRP